MTSTYTSNPPGNGIAFKSWLEAAEPGCETWKNCRYLVWGLGNSQWNAFLAFPRYVNSRLEQLGAAPVANFGFGDVGSPTWEDVYGSWQGPDLAGADRAGRGPAERSRGGQNRRRAGRRGEAHRNRLEHGDGVVARRVKINRSHDPHQRGRAHHPCGDRGCLPRAAGSRIPRQDPTPRGHPPRWVPLHRRAITSVSAPRTTSRPCPVWPGCSAPRPTACSLVPRSMNVRAVPKGVALQVRNVLTCLVDIASKPTVPLTDLLLEKVTEPLRPGQAGGDQACSADAGRGRLTPPRRALDEGRLQPVALTD